MSLFTRGWQIQFLVTLGPRSLFPYWPSAEGPSQLLEISAFLGTGPVHLQSQQRQVVPLLISPVIPSFLLSRAGATTWFHLENPG